VLSLKKNQIPVGDDLSGTLLRVVDLLLQALEMHSFRGNPDDHERFQAEIRGLREAFTETNAEAMLTAADSAIRMAEEYNQQTSRFIRMHALERQKVVARLTDTLAAMAGCPERSITQLRDLEHRISRTRAVEEVRRFGAQLADCLQGIRADSLRRTQRMEQILSALRRKVQTPPWGEQADVLQLNTDGSAGLPTRPKAEAALDTVLKAGGYGFVAAYVVDRVQLINARFGYAVGDEILAVFQKHLKQGLKQTDQLFRWTGPAFVVLMDRTGLSEGVRAEVNRLTSAKLETTVHLDHRSVLLPVTSTSAIFSLFETPSAAVLIQQIDAFTAGSTRS
jgi:diguanylate cyclase (GGDEF)-like protein